MNMWSTNNAACQLIQQPLKALLSNQSCLCCDQVLIQDTIKARERPLPTWPRKKSSRKKMSSDATRPTRRYQLHWTHGISPDHVPASVIQRSQAAQASHTWLASPLRCDSVIEKEVVRLARSRRESDGVVSQVRPMVSAGNVSDTKRKVTQRHWHIAKCRNHFLSLIALTSKGRRVKIRSTYGRAINTKIAGSVQSCTN